ncbi:MAG: bifunctional non-ous end joining protein LigD [Acidimicrobiaceae bacterium]
MTDTTVEIGGRQLKLSNLEKVLYPEVGFAKGEVIDYYARIAPTLLTHLGDRGITMRRFPNGVDDKSFFEKRCPKHRPEWVGVCPGPGDKGGAIDYCRLADVPSVVWAANLAALELHAPMARCGDIETPCMIVFDLDPGEPADIKDCAEVGLWIRDLFDDLKLQSFAKTSGSKGLQIYVPVNGQPLTHEQASQFALFVAQAMEKHHGDRVLSNMRKELRKGKVFIDWSQNSRHKTTICAYSLRARPHPTVSTPVTWEEVDAAASGAPLSFEAPEVLERVEKLGDLWESTATLVQAVPLP